MNISVLKKETKKLKEFAILEWTTADLEHYGRRPDWGQERYIFQALEKNTIVGFLDCALLLGVIEVKQLIVAQSKRGQGVGKKLMTEMEKYMREKGGHKVILSTGKSWVSEKFYESLGYVKIADLKDHFIHHDFVEYTKSLGK